mgnify:CR=1 FL=1
MAWPVRQVFNRDSIRFTLDLTRSFGTAAGRLLPLSGFPQRGRELGGHQ